MAERDFASVEPGLSMADLSLYNDRDNRVAAKRCVVSGADDTIGVSQSSAERCFHKRKRGFGSSHCYTATFHSEHGCRGIKRRRNAMVVCNR